MRTDFIDVAYHEGLIDWPQVRPQVRGGIVKASDLYFMPVELKGRVWYFYTSDPNKRWHQDPYFVRNWQGLDGKEIRGAYHFLRLNYENRPWDADATIERQAQIFYDIVSAAGLRDTDYIVADIEQSPAQISYLTVAQKRSRVRQFMDLCEAKFNRRLLAYTYHSWWHTEVGNPDWSLDYKLWIAHIASTPDIPKPWTSYWAHQFSWTGKISGIPGAVDLNVVGKDYSVIPPVPLTIEARLA